MEELWANVAGTRGRYRVSNEGRVVGPYGRVLRQYPGTTGYLEIKCRIDGKRKTQSVHRLVAEAFCPGFAAGLHALHRDGSRTNSSASNLYWGTPSQNTFDSVRDRTHVQARKTHCPQGHEYTESNTVNYKGRRRCRECNRVYSARRRGARMLSTQHTDKLG